MTIVFNIIIVVTVFNFIIFVHELGHFWAARWRGMKVDRFQIWFGKPIWKKTINGVQYGLGSIPFGGFVSLPQMAPMESIEGKALEDGEEPEKLTPVTPLDKIIVAFAGPLFSFLLAVACAFGVKALGVKEAPSDQAVIGYVEPGSPAEEAGVRIDDEVIAVSGTPVTAFSGSIDSFEGLIALSSGEKIELLVKRPGVAEPLTIQSGYEIPEAEYAYQRKGLRTIGVWPKQKIYIGYIMPNSPAAKAGLQPRDQIVAINDVRLESFRIMQEITSNAEGAKKYSYLRDGQEYSVMIEPQYPDEPADYGHKLIGMTFTSFLEEDIVLDYPAVSQQLKDSGSIMWKSLKAVADTNNDIGLGQMQGGIGMGHSMYNILASGAGWERLLWFLVIININLAILNLLPFPILDGGHIVMALYEWISGKMLPTKFLEMLQTACFLLIMGFFLYVTSKDVTEFLPSKQKPAVFYPAEQSQ